MKQTVFLLSLLWLITACSGLPKVYPDRNLSSAMRRRQCENLFPQGRWQFFHAIEAEMPGGRKGMLMGVTRISSAERTVQSVIMTIEGMVLFDARYDRELEVNRGIAPFDSDHFAQGLMQDIRLIFFAPSGTLIESGILENGAAVCRFQNPDRYFVDVIRHGADGWEIQQYDRQLRKRRTVRAFFDQGKIDPGRFNVPGRLKLTSHDPPGYTLDMDLIEAVRLEDSK